MNINFTDKLLVDICFGRQKSRGCVYNGQIVVDRNIMLEFRFNVDTLSWTWIYEPKYHVQNIGQIDMEKCSPNTMCL